MGLIKQGKGNSRRGQTMLEFLVLLPVLFLLLLATAEISRLFVISGKTEVAARYTALHLFRPESTPQGHPGANRYNYYLEDVFDPDHPETTSAMDVQQRVNEVFFEGVLGVIKFSQLQVDAPQEIKDVSAARPCDFVLLFF